MQEDQLVLADPKMEPGWEILCIDEHRASGRYTAELLARNEAKRLAILRALAEGMSIRSVARAYGLSHSTVIEAKRRWPAEIVTEKKRLAHSARSVAGMAIDRIAEEINEMPRASLPIIAGIMIEKSQLLDGDPTARVERVQSGVSHASINAILDALPVEALPVGEKVNVGQKAVAALAGGAGEPAVNGAQLQSLGDSLSPQLKS